MPIELRPLGPRTHEAAGFNEVVAVAAAQRVGWIRSDRAMGLRQALGGNDAAAAAC